MGVQGRVVERASAPLTQKKVGMIESVLVLVMEFSSSFDRIMWLS